MFLLTKLKKKKNSGQSVVARVIDSIEHVIRDSYLAEGPRWGVDNLFSLQLVSSKLTNNITQKYWSVAGITLHRWRPYMNSAYWEDILLTAFEMARNIYIKMTVTTGLLWCSQWVTYIIKYWGNFTCLTTYLTNGWDQCWQNIFARGSLWLRKITACPNILVPVLWSVQN